MVSSSIAGQAPRSLEDRASIRDGRGGRQPFPGCRGGSAWRRRGVGRPI